MGFHSQRYKDEDKIKGLIVNKRDFLKMFLFLGKIKLLWNAKSHITNQHAIVHIHAARKEFAAIVFLTTGEWENYRLATFRMTWNAGMIDP